MPVTISGTDGVTSPTFVGAVQGTTGTFSGAVQASGVTTNLYPLVSGTAVASTSGTSIDFTGIPSWVKRITVLFLNVRKSSTSSPLIQLITSGGAVATGYLCSGSSTSASSAVTAYTTGFGIRALGAADVIQGTLILSLIDTSNNWVASGVLTNTNSANTFATSGSVGLSGALTGVRITTTGADTFNQGTVNILYE